MKNFKNLSLFVAIILTFSTALSSFGLPVFAYEKSNVNFKQVKTLSDNNGTVLNKLNSVSSQDKSLFSSPSINTKEKIGLEKSQQIEVKKDYVEGEILVKYENTKINLNTTSGRMTALNFANSKSLEKKEDLRKNNILVLRIKDAKTVEQKIAELKNDPNIEYVEPNYKRFPSDINTNDTNKGLLWGLDNTGQVINSVTGTNDADIDAPEAWAINEGTNASIIVAVIDSGVAYNHPDLINNMWDGTNCKNDAGVLITGGCNHGYDYEDGDNTPLPTTSSHGTHIAGTIVAIKNNTKGIIGVAPQAKIMALKFLSETGGSVSNEIKAIDFAIQNGAKVINASFVGPAFSQLEYDAINRFKTAGGIFVAGAGNETTNNESTHSYPSDYNLDNIISVAATDQNDTLATFSNYGTTSVDVGAPGANIFSTVPQETTVLSQSFEGVALPAMPNGWVKGGASNNWETYTLDNGSFWGNVLYGDVNNFPYAQTANTTITSPTYNLSAGGANIDFWAKCDTEYSTTSWTDYMALEYSADGVNFLEANSILGKGKFDEVLFDLLNGDSSSVGGAVYHFKNLNIPNQYLTSNFEFRFRWVTDFSDNNYDGCWVDDVKITKFSDGSDEKYDYSNGTSMAAPHVAGLAALIEGYNPTLSLTQVKNAILTTGDSLVSLDGKTVSGKRINAFNALASLAPATHTISGTIKYYDGIKTVPNATVILENSIGAQVATTVTDANGAYQFTGVTNGGNYVVKVSKSDNIATNGVDVLDLTKFRRQIAEIEIFDQIFKKIAADVNVDLSINILDLVKIRRYIAEIDILPSEGWKFYSSDATLTTSNYLTEGLVRTYTNLTVNLPNQDFIGVKMGDVNNSWVNN